MAKKHVWQRILPPGLLLAAAVAVGVTGATVLHQMKLGNLIKTPPVEGHIEEDIKNTYKNASFVNDGEADVFLRVAYSETWLYQDENGNGNENDKIILPSLAEKKDGSGRIAVAAPVWNRTDWVDGGDGWLYYSHVLPGTASGKSEEERKTGNLVGEVKFLSKDEMNDLKDERYVEADYQLHFTMEIVQASDDKKVSQDAVKELFGRDAALPSDGWPENKYTCVIEWR